ncbi:MAG: hypothetical protein EB100_06760, partial [Crocinitomicaceae bacterium]|nr:hypothetical protein [Crocinitomicaceae bacterium]
MNDKLLNFFLKIQSLSKEEIEAIDKTMVTKQFKKGTILLKEGQTSSDAFFVLEGIVRQYCIIDGEEKTTDFFTDAQWVVSLNNINVKCAISRNDAVRPPNTTYVPISVKGIQTYINQPNNLMRPKAKENERAAYGFDIKRSGDLSQIIR